MSLLRKVLLSFTFALCSLNASALMITDNSGFTVGDPVVTFDEVALVSGQMVTNEFEPYGVTFDPNLFIEDFRTTVGFIGQSLANFNPVVNPFTINFVSDVDAFGAYWEFNVGTTATFDAYLNGILVDTFNYTEGDCCQTGSFLGFAGVNFDSVQVNIDTYGVMIMDNLFYSPVPEPAALVLLSLGLIGLGLVKRKS